MKILILTEVNRSRYLPTIGGVTRSAWFMHQALSEHSNCAYLINIYKYSFETGYVEIIDENNKKVKKLPEFQYNSSGYIDYIKEIASFIKKAKFDIIFVQSNSNQTMDILRVSRSPFIISIPNPAQHVHLNEGIEVDNNHISIKRQSWLINNAEAVRCLTKSNAENLLKYYPNVQYFVLPEGIYNEVELTKTNINIKKLKIEIAPNGEKIIYHISHWTKGKGLDFFAECIPDILKKFPKVKFVMAGDSSDNSQPGYKSNLKKIIRRLDIGEKVFFPGLLLDNEKNAYFKISDIFVLPSLHEGTPNVLLEAMAHKVPIVTTDVDGLKDMLNNEKTALKGPPPSSLIGRKIMTNNILRLLSDERLCNSLKDNAYRKVKTDYHWINFLPGLMDNFKIIIKERNNHNTNAQ